MLERMSWWAALAAVVAGTAAAAPLQKEEPQPWVVLITVDTLRADRVGGGEESLTPHIDALAEDGVRFERAMVQVPITFPSHASILTGSHPMHHGIRDFGGIRLKDERETLTEILNAEGYATAAFVSSFALDSTWGLDQGFQHYYDDFDLSGYKGIGFNAVERRGDRTVDQVLEWLDENASGSAPSPLFLWVHLFDPHDPYEPPSPYKEKFAQSPYDGEVAFADAQVGRLLKALKEKDVYERSLIVLMGDHGEGLGEHGEETHGFFIYNSTLHIPLVMKFPGGDYQGKRIQEVVQSVDVAPTVLQALRLRGGRRMQGRGLLGLLRNGRYPGKASSYGESLYARFHFGWSSLTSYQDERYKLIRAPRMEFYDLSQDPGETRNLYQSQTALAEQYDNLLDRVITKFKNREGEQDQQHDDMDEETRQRLQSLGYVTVAAESGSDMDDVGRADPKDKIEVFSKVRRATLASEEGQLKRSIELLRQVNKQDPDIYSARYLLGLNYFQERSLMLAVGEFKEAIRLFPDSADAVNALARAYLSLGLEDEARLGFEQLARLEPERPRGYLGQGGIALKEKQFDQAERFFRKAWELGEDNRAPIGLGRTLVARGDLQEGLDVFLQVLARYPRQPEIHQLLAYTYQQMNRPQDARRHQAILRQLTGSRP
ncbi:MAG TPA: sulfatase-like hydrolase/transferase [Acidobacteriota bacterium]|nr:sulfatase-like hydrolase/transferase [Acidobacteriota bacterium]